MVLRAKNLAAVFLICTSTANSQELFDEKTPTPGLVSLEKHEDYTSSYKNRRGKHGALFSVSFEKFYPIDYRSLFNDAYIEEIIQENRIDLVGIELGYKHNIGIASVALLGTMSQGRMDGEFAGLPRTLSISKQGLSANVALDGILEEPWVVPYAQFGIHQFNVSESSATESQSATTSMSFNYRYGLLFQLDWIENSIDKTAKADRLRSSGLENTYVDFYFSEHLASGNAIDPTNPTTDGDPNMLSSGEMGLGLKMEF